MLRERKKAAQRSKILKAALFCFARHGFERSKIEQIAKRAEVGKGSIYHYFPSKEVLFATVQKETLEELFRTMAEESDPKASPVEQLEAVLFRVFRFFQVNPDRYAIFVNALFAVSNRRNQKSPDSMLPPFEILAPKVHENVRKGNLHPDDADVEDLTLALLGMTSLFLHRWFRSPKTYELAKKIPRIAKIFVYGTLRHEKK